MLIKIKQILLYLTLIASIVITNALVELPKAANVNVFDYHRRIGIQEAKRIKHAEDQIHKVRPRIVGGIVSDISEIPYQAGIIIPITANLTSVCGGTLIMDNAVLTAAHCYADGVTAVQAFIVVLGSSFLFSGGQRIYTNEVVAHLDWNPETVFHDIAIVKIHPVTFTDAIQPIDLPVGSYLTNDLTGLYAIASGYGLTTDGGYLVLEQNLNSVIVQILPNAECQRVFGESVRDTNICTSGDGGRGTCSGDSGGPLVITSNGRRILVGITSFGALLGCEDGFPSVYTRVSSYMLWILAHALT